MKKSIMILTTVTAGFFCAAQSSKSTEDSVYAGPQDSVYVGSLDSARTGQNQKSLPNNKGVKFNTRYEYMEPNGATLIIQNSFPKSAIHYTAPDGKKYTYAIFWTQITNETINPIELKIDFPLDSFEFPLSSGNYMKLLIPSETMTLEKASLFDYGLPVKSFLDTGINKSYSLKRTINPKESTAFYVVTLSNHGSGGALRTGLSLKGQNLFYKISVYNNSTPELPLMDEKEINCGSINLKNLMSRK